MNLTSVLLVIILITISWAFYSLAKKYKKSTVLYVFLGLGTFILVVLLNAMLYVFSHFVSSNIGRATHRLVAFFVGVFVVVLIHYLLEKKWLKKMNIDAEEAIDEIGKE
ncbi:hypothetical protein ACOSP6_10305 [Tenacibaculum sp. MEBiC06402]|uniref:hypothetical protein n=1 Tax=unclassified Tenacibaculum TaxID=2635139 RepID=UPI003B9D6D9D